MELYNAIRNRRSVRRFKADPVPTDALERLLEAAQWAPSWAHTQCAQVVVCDDAAVKAALQACLSEKNPAYAAMAQAPLVVAFCARKGRAGFKQGQPSTPRGDGWLLFDTALAMQNFMLAAHAEGLATVCVGLFDAAKAAQALHVPPEAEVVALTPLGFADQTPNVPARKNVLDFYSRNIYRNPG